MLRHRAAYVPLFAPVLVLADGMTAKFATRDAVLAYIRADSEPRPRAAIMRYMFRRFGTSHAATRQQLHRLCKAGMIEVSERDWYRVVGAP